MQILLRLGQHTIAQHSPSSIAVRQSKHDQHALLPLRVTWLAEIPSDGLSDNLTPKEHGTVQGSLPAPLVALIIGRDVVLLSGAFVHRFKAVGWRWPGLAEFFRLASPSLPPSSPADAAAVEHAILRQPATASGSAHHSSTNLQGTQDAGHLRMDSNTAVAQPVGPVQPGQQESQENSVPLQHDSIPPAVFMQPLYISKVNTCFQLLLIGGCLSSSWYTWPPQEVILVLGFVTGGTTLASCIAYVRAFLKGSIK